MNFRKQEIELGDRVKDKISGFQGIVTSVTDFIAGCRRIGVSPEKLENGTIIESEVFDEANLTIIDKKVFKPIEPSKTDLKLGDRVRDKISGFEGIVTSSSKYLTSDGYFGVTPTQLKDGKPMDVKCLPYTILEKVDEKAVKVEKAQRPGGDQKIPRRTMY